MSQVVYFQGNPVNVMGHIPTPGNKGPAFTLVAKDLSELSLSQLGGKYKILNIFPSIDTSVCANSVRRFNQIAAELDNTAVLCISADLPFALSRFCDAEGLGRVTTLSTLRHPEFMANYGVGIADGALQGLAARAVLLLDENNNVLLSELVNEITQEPDYDVLLAVLNK